MTSFAVRVSSRLGAFTLDADFTADGRVVALFGPSGSGKSTILRMIAGLQRPNAGRIALSGRLVFDSEAGVDLSPRRRHVGYVFQDGLLFPHLSVRRNLLYGAWARKAPPVKALYERTLEILAIGHLLERMPVALSGGERQRVAIGRALLSNPAALLMDEPVSALDLESRGEILPYIEALTKATAVPILYVSHAREEVERLADRVVHIRDGRIVDITG